MFSSAPRVLSTSLVLSRWESRASRAPSTNVESLTNERAGHVALSVVDDAVARLLRSQASVVFRTSSPLPRQAIARSRLLMSVKLVYSVASSNEQFKH